MGETYIKAGVDIETAGKTTELISEYARSTFGPEVLTGLGFFGGLFEFKGFKHPVLVSSVDGVGTKLKIASLLDKHDTIGIDIVNHCVNDILTGGAEPLFFLDYVAMGKLVPQQVAAVAQGLAQACREVGCALIGGETAEMPGLYRVGDYDLAGFIVGVVEKDRIIQGKTIVAGDSILGLPSSGLHTNGYSLVRRVFGETRATLDTYYPELKATLGEVLLKPHRSYYLKLKPQLPLIKGMAHITGGGLIGNVPRILPQGLTARFHQQLWTVPPIFRLIQKRGEVTEAEMYRVFNMGVGMVVIGSPDNARQITAALPEARVIGEVIKQEGKPRVIIDKTKNN
ncbi:MAG: phosphoribosylformylglycinamidine cyclo-ligase [Dehalococcoidales bacterium]|nr:phosphoribosylformylglycinamidine cyclo-ligase [Dehalococcoidales bacterium]